MTSSDASTGWESGNSTATDRPAVPPFWWSETGGLIGPVIPLTEVPADAVRLIPDTPSLRLMGASIIDSQATELAHVTRERDEALGRIASAEQVQTRMAMSLPDHGPWQAWSERDRAVRDYEGDLSTALATETNLVAELRAQRDAALGLHASAKNYTGCRACYRDWPCPTARALGITDV